MLLNCDSSNFDQIYFFGDSLSDTGNFFNFTSNIPIPGFPFPDSPYAEGRFSNGDVWVDYFSDELGFTVEPFTSLTNSNDGINFAIGGASSSNNNAGNVPEAGLFFPGLTFQIESFVNLFEPLENPNSEEILKDDLFFLWIGANDYLSFINDDPTTPDVIEADFPRRGKDIKNAVIEVVDLNIAEAVQDIIDLGGENLVIFNLPDLDQTPLGQSLEQKDRKQLQKLVKKHNKALLDFVDKTEALNPDVNLIEIDTNQLFDEILDDPGVFGFSNVTDNFIGVDLYTGISQPHAGTDPNQYLFWDSVHPTTGIHELVADLVIDELSNEGFII